MRIISGSYGGRKYNGKIPEGIRPTMDNVREAVFNILSNYIDLENKFVCDICAGTGAFGFEALSRGSRYCLFIDKSKKACEFIKKAAFYFSIPEETYSIICGDASSVLNKYKKNPESHTFDLIFLDPPYQSEIYNNIIYSIQKNNLLSDEGIFIIEHDLSLGFIMADGFTKLSERVYGSTCVTIYKLTSLL